jgi:chemotaxis protein MotB
MAGKAGSRNDRRPIIIKRVEEVGAGHHGGAWKVAYADFVTAMMAFFLLMWLLNATTVKQREGLATYFTPSNILSKNSSGSGQPFGGKSPNDDGNAVSDRGVEAVMVGTAPAQSDPQLDPQPDARTPFSAAGNQDPSADAQGMQGHTGAAVQPGDKNNGGGQATNASVVPARADYLAQAASGSAAKLDPHATDPSQLAYAALRGELEKREVAAFQKAAQAITEAVRADPALQALAKQLSIDMVPEGLRVQILDADRRPMFATGSSELDEQAKMLLAKIAPVLAKLPEAIALSGHTDAMPYVGGGKTNWELSTERANATRRLLVENGLDDSRFRSITGDADRDPLVPNDPMAAANRRIAIVVLRATGPLPPALEAPAPITAAPAAAAPGAAAPALSAPAK